MLAASILLAGCSGGAKPGQSASSSSPPSSTSAPTVSVSPSATGPTTDPNIAAAARAHTPAGAEAFVRYFFEQLNRSWARADPLLLPPLSEASCKTCRAFTASAASFRAKGQHYKGDVFTVSSVGGLGKGSNGEEVLVVGQQEPGAIVNQSGTIIEKSVAQAGKFTVSLNWTGSGWMAAELQVMR